MTNVEGDGGVATAVPLTEQAVLAGPRVSTIRLDTVAKDLGIIDTAGAGRWCMNARCGCYSL